MGGSAFPTLHVPRLSHEQYYELRDKCLAILKGDFYNQVITAPEAPSKPDHGDIDILVSEPIYQFRAADILASLGAIQHTKVSITTSFAIPLAPEQYDGEGRRVCAQVDVHVCPPGNLEWEVFLGSYGDMMQILGVLNRAIGFTANDKGFQLRIPEIELYNRKKSMIFLTKDPRETIEFLGLDFNRYSKGFDMNEQIFEWSAAGRLYAPPGKTKMHENSKDRQRYRKRQMFSTCVNEYFPSHLEIWHGRRLWTRKEVCEEALSYFPHARPAYLAAMAEHKQHRWEQEVFRDIKAAIPLEDESSDEVMRGLKRFVTYTEEGKPALCNASPGERSEKPRWLAKITTSKQKDEFVEWVGKNWSDVRELENNRVSAMKAGLVHT